MPKVNAKIKPLRPIKVADKRIKKIIEDYSGYTDRDANYVWMTRDPGYGYENVYMVFLQLKKIQKDDAEKGVFGFIVDVEKMEVITEIDTFEASRKYGSPELKDYFDDELDEKVNLKKSLKPLIESIIKESIPSEQYIIIVGDNIEAGGISNLEDAKNKAKSYMAKVGPRPSTWPSVWKLVIEYTNKDK